MSLDYLRSQSVPPTRGERLHAAWRRLYPVAIYALATLAVWLSGAAFGYVLRMATEGR